MHLWVRSLHPMQDKLRPQASNSTSQTHDHAAQQQQLYTSIRSLKHFTARICIFSRLWYIFKTVIGCHSNISAASHQKKPWIDSICNWQELRWLKRRHNLQSYLRCVNGGICHYFWQAHAKRQTYLLNSATCLIMPSLKWQCNLPAKVEMFE